MIEADVHDRSISSDKVEIAELGGFQSFRVLISLS